MKDYVKAFYRAGLFLIFARIWDYFGKTDYRVANFKIALFVMTIEIIVIFCSRIKNKRKKDKEKQGIEP